MKKTVKTACGILALCTAFGFCGCKGKGDPNTIKLTVWVSEADRAFAQSVVDPCPFLNGRVTSHGYRT